MLHTTAQERYEKLKRVNIAVRRDRAAHAKVRDLCPHRIALRLPDDSRDRLPSLFVSEGQLESTLRRLRPQVIIQRHASPEEFSEY